MSKHPTQRHGGHYWFRPEPPTHPQRDDHPPEGLLRALAEQEYRTEAEGLSYAEFTMRNELIRQARAALAASKDKPDSSMGQAEGTR